MANVTVQTLHEMLYKGPKINFDIPIGTIRKMVPISSNEGAGMRWKALPAKLLMESRVASSGTLKGVALEGIEIGQGLRDAARILGLARMTAGGRTRYDPDERVLECKPAGLLALAILAHYFGGRLERSAPAIRRILRREKNGLRETGPKDAAFALLCVHLAKKGVGPLFSDLRPGHDATKLLLGAGIHDTAPVTQELLEIQLDGLNAIYEGAKAKFAD